MFGFAAISNPKCSYASRVAMPRGVRLRKPIWSSAAGVASSYQIVTHEVELDGEALNWSSTGDSRTFSLDGVQINVGCSTIVASRVDEI